MKANKMWHTSGHYDPRQGLVTRVRRGAAARQLAVFLRHQVEYRVRKGLQDTAGCSLLSPDRHSRRSRENPERSGAEWNQALGS